MYVVHFLTEIAHFVCRTPYHFLITSSQGLTKVDQSLSFNYSLLEPPCFSPSDTIGDLKKLIAAQTGTKHDKIVLKKWYIIYKDNITLEDYEVHDGFNFELYYQ